MPAVLALAGMKDVQFHFDIGFSKNTFFEFNFSSICWAFTVQGVYEGFYSSGSL